MPLNLRHLMCLLAAVTAIAVVGATTASADTITLHRQVLLTEVCPIPPYDNPTCAPIHEVVPLKITYDTATIAIATHEDLPGVWTIDAAFENTVGITPAANPFDPPNFHDTFGIAEFRNGFAGYLFNTLDAFGEEVCDLGDPCQRVEQHEWWSYLEISDEGVLFPLASPPTIADLYSLLHHGRFHYETYSQVYNYAGQTFGPDSRMYNGVIPEPPQMALFALGLAVAAFHAQTGRRTRLVA